ncbi:MAG: DUF2079 domain-containing protein, partial [Victivallales bacterium]|nr:DUF2079 domain-containing protein [Victivallales bacterium]
MDTTSSRRGAWTYNILLKQAPYIVLWGGILGFAIFQNFFRLVSINLIYYIVLEYKDIFPEELMFSLFTGMIITSYTFYSAGRSWERSTKEIAPVFYPLVLLIPFFFIPIGVHTPLIFIATVTVMVFRYFRLISQEAELHFRQFDFKRKRTGLIIVALFSAGFVAYGFYIQKRAFDGMYLCWSDWAYFYESMRNTLSGNWFWLNIRHMNFMGVRFYPGLTILLPYIMLFDNEYAFFLMSSVVLVSGGVIIYLLGRRLKFSLFESTFFALGYLLIPGVFNMNLAIFYSFHEIYFVIPLVFLTFYFFEGKRYVPALLLFLFSMTFKETVPVLWLGFGVVFVLQRRFKLAAFVIITSLTYFSLVNFMVMPWIRQGMTDISLVRYHKLGDNALQIALSPFIRPDAFWGALFRPGTFYFLGTLLLPVFILTLSSPLMLLAMSMVFVFLCIESTDQTQNIMLHYQSMIITVIMLNSMYAYQRMKNGRTSPWFNILGFGMQSKVGVPVAVIASTAASLLLCVLFLTQNHISKNGVSHF